ncbi:MAG: GHMP family kinase ATP-binding protein [Tumebacillaceae bacterium]
MSPQKHADHTYKETPTSHPKTSGNGRSFGTFGELLQGTLTEGEADQDFLVTFPIQCYARATFSVEPVRSDLRVVPASKQKSRTLACLILTHFQRPIGGTLVIESDIPIGKGLASSSADLVATARAVCDAYDLELSDDLLHAFMRQIEPSDGVMYQGVVSFYHRSVELREFIGLMPPITIVAVDEGGIVDTVEFNKIAKPFTDEDKVEYQHLLELATTAIRNCDLPTIGYVSTRSAMLNQKLRPKKWLTPLIELSQAIGGLGVVVAHSGTCLGLLLGNQDANYQERLAKAKANMIALAGDVTVYQSWSEVGL